MGRPLGAGCTGEVKLAFHKDTGREVAIKMIRFVSCFVCCVCCGSSCFFCVSCFLGGYFCVVFVVLGIINGVFLLKFFVVVVVVVVVLLLLVVVVGINCCYRRSFVVVCLVFLFSLFHPFFLPANPSLSINPRCSKKLKEKLQ